MRLDETLCNTCQTTADNLGFSPGNEIETLTSEHLRGTGERKQRGAMSKKIVSYDTEYVRNEKCLTKWTLKEGAMPERPVTCGKPAVAGTGRSPRACSEHLDGLKALESGEFTMELGPKIPGGEN